MANKMRVRAKLKNGVTEVKALINHPMETGQRKDKKTGKLIPAHFIEEVLCEYKGETVMKANLSGGISKNPYLGFRLSGIASGDTLKIAWKDNAGGSDAMEVAVK